MKSKEYLYLLVLTISAFKICEGSNILGLFPHPGFSHFKVFYPLLSSLAENGHNLTVVTYVKSKNTLPNYREIIIRGEETTHTFEFKMFIPSRSLEAMLSEFFALYNEGKRACKVFYESGAVEDILKTHANNPYDLVIMENFNTDCYLGVPYLLKVPIVALSSCALMPWHYDRVALPDSPSFIPSEFVGFSERMSFSERLVNFIVTKGTALLYRMTTERSDNQIIKEKLNIDVDVREIAKTQSLVLVNQHYSLSGSRPIPSRVIEIGGVHIQENVNEKIPQNIEEFLQKSENGVIFISWGSMIKASSLEKTKVLAMVKSLEKLPQNILWKWENDDVPTKSKKFMFTKWAPQKEILCHPKVKIFWSHGGLLGVSESVYCAKPLVVSPIYGDQFLNGKAVENRKMGIILYHDSINEQEISKVFKKITGPEYAENANYVSKVYRNRQNSPLETAIWWVEHVLDTKGNNLSYSPAVELNGFVYYSLDVISVLLSVVVFIAVVFPILVCKFCCGNPKKDIKKKKVKFS